MSCQFFDKIMNNQKKNLDKLDQSECTSAYEKSQWATDGTQQINHGYLLQGDDLRVFEFGIVNSEGYKTLAKRRIVGLVANESIAC